MSPQLAFIEQPGKGLVVSSDPVHTGDLIWQEVLDWLVRAIGEIGRKEVIDALDTNKSTLSETLAATPERNARRKSEGQTEILFRGPWIPVVLAMASDSMRHELFRILCRPFGFEPERKKKLTPEEENRRMREFFASQSPAALKAFDEDIGR